MFYSYSKLVEDAGLVAVHSLAATVAFGSPFLTRSCMLSERLQYHRRPVGAVQPRHAGGTVCFSLLSEADAFLKNK